MEFVELDPLYDIVEPSPVTLEDYLTVFPDGEAEFDGLIFFGAADVDAEGEPQLVGSHMTPEQAQVFADRVWDMAAAMIEARG